MLALGYTRYITSAWQAEGRGLLIQCSAPARSTHDAVSELANVLKSICVAAFSPVCAAPTWGGSIPQRASAPFHFLHRFTLRGLFSLFVTESEIATEPFSGQRKSLRDSEKSSGSQKADVNG